MKQPTKYVNYDYLFKRLHRKYHQSKVPRIYLVNGRYPVPHEGGYDWTVGYCDTLSEAEALRERLIVELKNLRRQTGKLYAAEQNAYLFYSNARYMEPRPSEDFLKRLGDVWDEATKVYRNKLDEVYAPMLDQDMPWLYSHIFERQGSCDGPIQYHIQEVLKCQVPV